METNMERYYNDIQKAFAEDEKAYEDGVLEAAKLIMEKKTVKMVFVCGASCAGKTPTTERLSHYLNEHGIKTELVSLDDFYRNPEDAIIKEDGTPDYECPESLELDLLHKCFTALCNGETTWMPRFDFMEKKRDDKSRLMHISDDELCIVEGLHSLNPEICGSYIDSEKTFKLYLDANTEKDDEPRLVRRIVRDYYKRNSSAENTLDMWDDVEEGSRKYIYPYKDSADYTINTYINYELYVMRDDALRMLAEVPENSPHRAKAEELMAELLPLPSLPKSAITPQSFMREFITQRT